MTLGQEENAILDSCLGKGISEAGGETMMKANVRHREDGNKNRQTSKKQDPVEMWNFLETSER